MKWFKVNDEILIKAKTKEEAQQIYLKEKIFITFDVSEKGYRKIDFPVKNRSKGVCCYNYI